ncbi:MAG: DUF4180 domain-containing protein [Gammaproteobacteria bacterium]|nr:DUF4180 domain-containing protein [Gammaproteobacteria bacterium]
MAAIHREGSGLILGSHDEIAEVLSRSLSQSGIVLNERDLAPAFFDLSTRIAGELFQKIINYHSLLAIVVVDPARYGERFSELVHEHQDHSHIRFFKNQTDAELWLTAVT